MNIQLPDVEDVAEVKQVVVNRFTDGRPSLTYINYYTTDGKFWQELIDSTRLIQFDHYFNLAHKTRVVTCDKTTGVTAYIPEDS